MKFLIASLALLFASGAHAQYWQDKQVAEMLVRELSPTQSMEGGQWFVSTDVLRPGTLGLGIIYVHIPGSAGNVSLHAALYQWTAQGWTMSARVQNLFGMSPQKPAFLPGRVEVSTMTLGPNDPRCCPTAEKRWSIDFGSGLATPLN